MRTPIIAGNWKMNKTVSEAVAFVRELHGNLNESPVVDAVVCPPAIALPAVAKELVGSPITVGAQNMYFEEKGAYTGELAPAMIAPFCTYVILGHSERRAYFCETDEAVNKKAKKALEHGLIPIICVGESLEQNEAGETHPFVSGQVSAALAGIPAESVAGMIIAYEPIWAIGTGKAASAAVANSLIASTIRATISDLYDEETAQKVRVQYGGSTNPDNIEEFMAEPEIDGALVGGASLKPGFVEMIKKTEALYR
jgi:triosephosphate isomerase